MIEADQVTQVITPTPPVWALHRDVESLEQVPQAIALCKEQLEIQRHLQTLGIAASPDQPIHVEGKAPALPATSWRARVWQRDDGYRVEVETW